MMFGWLRRAADWASRWNRLRSSSSEPMAADMVLMATSRLRMPSWARYTSPMAPWPILPTISYLPRRWRSIDAGVERARTLNADDNTRRPAARKPRPRALPAADRAALGVWGEAA